MLLDRAGWHATGNLVRPRNVTPILLPSRSLELNAVEQVWQHLRANYLTNRVFDNFDAISTPPAMQGENSSHSRSRSL